MDYEIITYDGKRYKVKQKDPQVLARLASKLDLIPVTLENGDIEYFAKGTVARLGCSPQTEEELFKKEQEEFIRSKQ